ncbi:site-specific DNA-methyltransferase, partial [bacterium]|nr:site-specific DNA-methyltransferase [bacterium]
VSAKAILRVAARQDIQRDLFADPEQEYREAVQFYQHDVDWSNRLILGDSLMVMSSLARREDLAGKVQMIYIDPPYGIKFSSNFQPTVFQRDVKDRAQDLTREPEQIKAYRDTWNLGIHSYLAYLRDRLIVAKELLTDSGSIFVQIGDENVHRVRCLMDEVFGSENFVSLITFRTATSQPSNTIASVSDYLLWYSKQIDQLKCHQIFRPRLLTEKTSTYNWIELKDDTCRRLTSAEASGKVGIPEGYLFKDSDLTRKLNPNDEQKRIEYKGSVYEPPKGLKYHEGIEKLINCDRVIVINDRLCGKRYEMDYPVVKYTNLWDDTIMGTFALSKDPKIYVVQTNPKVIERCLLMTTDPGDLVLDPTCGSGTTAYVAEQWGRRWIAIDTSRVAIALARQRLLTATFDYYNLKDESEGISDGFIYKTVPHITLGSIAKNVALDPIFAKHEPILAEKLQALNRTLKDVTSEIRAKLFAKLAEKEKQEGKNSITEADKRRWQLPKTEWKEWEVPFDTDEDWPSQLQGALIAYRKAWRAKMDEVNECIAASAVQEELVDQPEVDRKKLRVSGPFTVEAVQPAEESLDLEPPIGGEPDEMETFAGDRDSSLRSELRSNELSVANRMTDAHEPTNAEAYLDQMIRLLRNDGVRFPNNKTMKFAELDPLEGDVLHAEGYWQDDENERWVAVAFGPQHGPVTAMQVEDCLRVAYRRGYDELVFAGFSFDGTAQAVIQDDPNPRVRVHIAHINPDVTMDDLLKDTPSSQLFTVFGLPRTSINMTGNGEYIVRMEGVDIYNPVDNSVYSAGADKVAAWFLDSDYDGRTFCITQAFFPDKKAWSKIARALKGVIDEERFEAFSGTESLPFPVGEHDRAAVKVIDPRGNEVMRVHNLKGFTY